jgi:arylsulfatase A-like enzyme
MDLKYFTQEQIQVEQVNFLITRIQLFAGIMLLTLLNVACTSVETEVDQPNIIIIYADDLGYGDLSCYGSESIRTPYLDKMAAQGIKFTNFYAQTVCGPSRAALMTGSYPSRIAQQSTQRELHPVVHAKEIMIPEILKQENYATACFGKWDMARHSQTKFVSELMPNFQGFDYFFGTPTSNDSSVRLMKNEEIVDEKADFTTLTKKYTDEAINFMRTSSEKPFFIYLAHTMPHVIIDASEQFKGKSIRGLYGDVIEEIDWNIGRVFKELKTLGLDSNTYVIFMSDNGPWYLENHKKLSTYKDKGGFYGGSSGPLRGHKTSTWEGGLRVPCIMWGPQIPAGETCDEIASTMDMLPTIGNLVGADISKDIVIDGRDIRSLMFGEKKFFDEERIFYYYQDTFLQAVRKGNWKLHIPNTKKEGWEVWHKEEDWIIFTKPVLYNLENDPGETTDLSSENPEKVAELLTDIELARKELGDGKHIGNGVRTFH